MSCYTLRFVKGRRIDPGSDALILISQIKVAPPSKLSSPTLATGGADFWPPYQVSEQTNHRRGLRWGS
jgi:hypothetical protein